MVECCFTAATSGISTKGDFSFLLSRAPSRKSVWRRIRHPRTCGCACARESRGWTALGLPPRRERERESAALAKERERERERGSRERERDAIVLNCIQKPGNHVTEGTLINVSGEAEPKSRLRGTARGGLLWQASRKTCSKQGDLTPALSREERARECVQLPATTLAKESAGETRTQAGGRKERRTAPRHLRADGRGGGQALLTHRRAQQDLRGISHLSKIGQWWLSSRR